MKKVAAVCHTNTDDNFFFQGRGNFFFFFREKNTTPEKGKFGSTLTEGRGKEGVTRQK